MSESVGNHVHIVQSPKYSMNHKTQDPDKKPHKKKGRRFKEPAQLKIKEVEPPAVMKGSTFSPTSKENKDSRNNMLTKATLSENNRHLNAHY